MMRIDLVLTNEVLHSNNKVLKFALKFHMHQEHAKFYREIAISGSDNEAGLKRCIRIGERFGFSYAPQEDAPLQILEQIKIILLQIRGAHSSW